MTNSVELREQRQGAYPSERAKLLQTRDGYHDMTGEDLFFILSTMYQERAKRLGKLGSDNPPDEFVFPGSKGEVRVSRYENYGRHSGDQVAYNVSFMRSDGAECEIGTGGKARRKKQSPKR